MIHKKTDFEKIFFTNFKKDMDIKNSGSCLKSNLSLIKFLDAGIQDVSTSISIVNNLIER